MPHTINGIGTWYYGKRNYSRRQGVCQSCKREAVLEDYDTRLFVVVIFIPIIPLNRVHVMNKCSRCSRHNAIPGGKWDELLAKAATAEDAANRNPRDEQLAIDVLAACYQLRDIDRLNRIGPDYEARFAGNQRVLAALSEAYSSFGRVAEAERVLRNAVEKTTEAKPHEALGRFLAQTNRPAEAQAHLQHIIDDNVVDRVDDIYLLAQAYQRAGQHREAIEMFDAVRKLHPPIEQNPAYLKFRAASASLINTNKPVDGVKMLRAEQKRARGGKMLLIGAIVAALAVGVYALVSVFSGYRTTVYVLNGLDRQYSVIINGTPHSLSPHTVTPIVLPQGTEHIETPELKGLAPVDVKIKTPFVSRPFNSDVFVINPDRGAVIVKAEVPYAKERSNARGGRSSLTTGHPFIAFSGVDYPFNTPPNEIELPNPTSVVMKTELQLLQQKRDWPVQSLVSTLQRQTPAEDVQQFIESQAGYGTDSTLYIAMLPEVLPTNELASFIQLHIAEHADNVSWNRMYIQALSQQGRVQEASKEYEARLAKDPSNRLSQFLTAIAVHEPARYIELIKKAAVEPGAIPDAHIRLCGYYGEIGENDLAAAEADIAMQKMSADTETRYYALAAYIADRQYDKALKIAGEDAKNPTSDFTHAARTTSWLLRQLGRGADADAQLAMLENLLKPYNEQKQQSALYQYKGNVAYMNGDTAGTTSNLQLSNTPFDRFVGDIVAGNLQEASNESDRMDAMPGQSRDNEGRMMIAAMLYVAAAKSDAGIARTALEKLTRLLGDSDYEDRLYAQALLGKSEPSDEVITHLRGAAVRNRIILTAIGLSNPVRAKACFEMVRKINMDPEFPKLQIDKAINN